MLVLGGCSLALGLVGVFVPLLPTAPFIILSAFLFSKCSERFHNYLLNHFITGPLIINWQKHGAIPIYGKLMAILTIMISIVWIFLRVKLASFSFVICGALLLILLFILTRPTSSCKN
jgi:uncharacterized membrane protein YbaN (DUF454 family)